MAKLITSSLWPAITEAARASSRPAHVAVAYFGEAGATLLPLPKGSILAVDASINTISSGATCPRALERMLVAGTEVFSVQHLHAKAYAFDKLGFVGSPNASNHSSRQLVEAALCVDSIVEIAEIRDFVSSLCLTKLSKTDLIELSSYY